MGLLDDFLTTIDNKKRKIKRGLLDMVDNPQQFAGLLADRMQEDRYGGPENAQAMKQYLTKQPYDQSALTAANDALRNAAINESLGAVTVWHGSPHKFDKFDMSKIGTGEGAQAYGNGLYMAESKDVADEYAGKLSRKIVEFANKTPTTFAERELAKRLESVANSTQYGSGLSEVSKAYLRIESPSKDMLYGNSFVGIKPLDKKSLGKALVLQRAAKRLGAPNVGDAGSLYKVDIPDEAVSRFLDWDKPLSQQAPEVQVAISKMRDQFPISKEGWDIKPWMDADPLASTWHNEAVRNLDIGQDFFTKNLAENGVPGIRYLDGGSRGTGAGTSNYVLFDDQLPRILERNGQPTGLQPWKPGEWSLGYGLLGDTK